MVGGWTPATHCTIALPCEDSKTDHQDAAHSCYIARGQAAGDKDQQLPASSLTKTNLT